ncbi:MAG: DNA polymerase Y family protein [Defluviicoccus sp.]|nr:DNA polymerase Y family protein [Defluviicoccus sp.]MDE0275448.1 DNA polymerase Y family protein [Defluviicoccus sp.]
MKRVVSLWLPRFATDRLKRSAGRADAPVSRREPPLATVESREGRLLLVGLNRGAASAGLYSGQPLGDARAILPSLRSVPADPAAEIRELERLARRCGRYSPWTVPAPAAGGTPDGTGAIWLDITGCAHLCGGEAALAGDLIGRLGATGYEARAAIADTPGAAWAVCRFATDDAARPRIVARGGARRALAPLPVAALRLASETAASLDSLGLRTVASLLDLPRGAIADRFGSEVGARLDAALGLVNEPIAPAAPATPRFARIDFAEPIGRAEDIAAALDRLLGNLVRDLALGGRGARRLVLSLFEPAGDPHRFAVGTGKPSRDAGHLAALFAAPMESFETVYGIEAMTLTAPVTEPLDPRQTAFHEEKTGGDTDALIDRLANRLGGGRVVRFAPRESRIPERATIATPVLDRRVESTAAWPAPPRPIRLLAPPEPIEVVAPVPDDPPVMFRWRRVRRRVVRAEGPERIAPEWWHKPDADDESGLRDYYRVEDENGRRYWLYREGLYRPDVPPAWFLHGLFA